MKLLSISACLFASLLLMPTLSAKTLVELDDFPDWFKDGMKREQKVRKKSSLKIKELNVNQKVKGKLSPQDSGEDYWYFLLDIGTATPVECYVFLEFDGTATSFYSIIDLSLQGVAELNKKPLTAKYNYAIDSDVVHDTPYLRLDTLYNLGEGSEKVAGVLKGYAAQTEQSLQICIHNEIGYQKTFFGVFESFLSAIVANQKSPAFFAPIYQFMLNDIPIGYGREKYTTDADGDVNIQRDSAFMIPVDASSIARSDSVATEWSNPDGSLINANVYTLENGAMTSQFNIGYIENKWQVEGELQGKAIKSELTHDDWLISGFGSHIETAKLRKSAENSAEFNMWIPEADPTSALKLVISKVVDDSKANLKLDMGPITMQFLADKNGILKQGSMQQGGVNMNINLLSVKGEPKLP
jgi:hypothetical protein